MFEEFFWNRGFTLKYLLFTFLNEFIITGDITCRSKCDVRMNNLDIHLKNSLEGVILTIGGSSYKSELCLERRNNGRYLIINCPSSKYGKNI